MFPPHLPISGTQVAWRQIMASQITMRGSQLLASLELLLVVCGSVLVAGATALLQSEGTLRERLWSALVIALAPACIAWPQLFRVRVARGTVRSRVARRA
jgi:hypothetical protein